MAVEEAAGDLDVALSSSRLGTKEYWDDTFARDLNIYAETKDAGEVWFGEDSVERVADWLDSSDEITTDSSVLDIGCGNGMMLIELAQRGYTHLTGTDYSVSAVELARRVAADQQLSITYEIGNMLEENTPQDGPLRDVSVYDVCLDKGTYDAVSLNPDNSCLQRERYASNVRRLTRVDGGLFIITSCNWTQDELVEQFKQGFELVKKIPTSTFQFGGKTGNKETVLIFKRTN